VNFTREPIIETIISAREGFKLSLKSSKTAAGEEILVDAIEVVSFGGSFFYRCSEKAKPFFIPAGDYEIVEVRETRLVLKTANVEKAIKIGGGKDSHKHNKPQPAPATEVSDLEEKIQVASEESPPLRQEGKRDKKRYRKKKGNNNNHREDRSSASVSPSGEVQAPKEGEIITSASMFSHLLRPPENLISESLQKKYRKEELLTAPEVASAVTSKGETPPLWIKTQETTFTEEVKADAELISEAPEPYDRLEEDNKGDPLLHLSLPDFEDRM
jgi:hypothetical protein